MAKPRKCGQPKSYYKEPRMSERAPHSDKSCFRVLLRVDVDWCSSGIWEIPTIGYPYAGTSIGYDSLGLPQWLIDRFDYWTSWHDSCEPWLSRVELDSELYFAYAMSLAIDLKKHLGDDYYVECNGREIHDDRAYLRRAHDQQIQAEQ